jgi:quinol monooxygenase YgiN
MTPPRVTVLIEYRAQPDRLETAITELDRLIATVVAEEPDCFGIRLLQDPEDPARFLLFEEWASREAYIGPHFQTPHLQDFIARAPAFLAGPPEIRFWNLKAEYPGMQVPPGGARPGRAT